MLTLVVGRRIAQRNRVMCAVFSILSLLSLAQAQDYTYTVSNSEATITGYSGPGGDITIPVMIEGWPVTAIGDSAFRQQTNLLSVTIPDGVDTIGLGAFSFCRNLTRVSISKTVSFVNYRAFDSCLSLTNISVDPLSSEFSSEDGVLFNKFQTVLVQCPGGKTGTYDIPNTVTNIGIGAFQTCMKLKNVTIPNSVTSIRLQAFSACTNLSSISIPDGVESIEIGVFFLCLNLTNVSFSKNVSSIGRGAFSDCVSLKSVMLPESLVSIGDLVFVNCSNLTSAYFPGDVPTSVGQGVFLRADNTTAYYLPDATGWGDTFSELPASPTAIWQPLLSASPPNNNQVQFNIDWAKDFTVEVEAADYVVNPNWTTIDTVTLNDGQGQFTAPLDQSNKFYRLKWE